MTGWNFVRVTPRRSRHAADATSAHCAQWRQNARGMYPGASQLSGIPY
ncbi:MAG: hypothetical protein AVDCRST_MAG93-3099 [uncultured Chloroflexia bacterium]|uniref:Uncharacterized protein n=1 Tax=uncultured Chloroflexia bacterium TaxID=1672391 RepID=A0A6J4JHY7_9CHLR|nr:MAG: hypothetical protein AVDCRST_MAG93-3099 [uncultured Chloroflexia bacterium]